MTGDAPDLDPAAPAEEKDMGLDQVVAAGVAAGLVAGCGTTGPVVRSDGPAAVSPASIRVERDPASGLAEAILPNGLKILVLERPGIPVVSHQVWYRVGSVDERPGETGLAHYLEHVMFKGTRNLEKGQIDRITFVGGGANNASTWNDFTAYYFNFASSRWPLALAIEADRMRNCTFVPEEFEAERGAVMNEMHAGHDAPGGRLDEQLDATGYVVHPYHHPTIGWRQEVETVARSTTIAFYDRYYMPNNATLVVVGDVTAEEVVREAAKAFADVEPGPPPPPVLEVEPNQRGERRFVIVEDTDTPRLEIAWHTCRVGDPDDPALEVAAAILGTGKSSRLVQRLVETDQTCVDVSVWNETRKFPGRFKIWCEGQESADPRDIERAVHEEIARLTAGPLDDREVEKARNNLLARDLYAQETVQGTADRIGYSETVSGWRQWAEWPDRIRAVTADDVQRVLRTYATTNNRTVGWSVSPAQALLASPGTPADAAPPPLPDGDADAQARRTEPPVEPDVAPTFRGGHDSPLDLTSAEGPVDPIVLAPRVERLENGLTVLLQPREGLPVVAFDLFVDAGQLREAKPGLAWFTGTMLDEGAAGRSSEAIAQTLDFLGATLATVPTGARARCLAKDTETVLGLLGDVVLQPDFPDEAIEKVRRAILSEIAMDENDPGAVARAAFLAAVYGDHPLARLPRGDRAAVESVAADDLRAHHTAHFVAGDAILAVVGDFDPDALMPLIQARFGSWTAEGVAAPALPEIAALPATVRVDRPMPGKTQSKVYMGNVGVRRSDPDYAALKVLEHILGTGPGFTDRLSKDLRDTQGLAYSVYGNITRSAGVEPGTFTAYIACLGADLDRAMDGMQGHLRRIREEEVTDRELADAQSYLAGVQPFRFETSPQIAGALVELQRFGLGFDEPARELAAVRAVTKADVLRVAKKHLHPDHMAIVVGGFTGE